MIDLDAIKARYEAAHELPCEKMSAQDIAQLRVDVKRLIKEVERLKKEAQDE